MARRAKVVKLVEDLDPVTRLYCEQLFDHLTLGSKEWPGGDPDQLHRVPPVPRAWTAEELAQADRTVMEGVHIA
jgi:hypothetical protein